MKHRISFETNHIGQCFLIILLCISTSISVAAGPRRLPEGASPGDGSRFTRPDGVERGDRSSGRSDRTRPIVDEPVVDDPGGSGGGGYSSLVQPEIDPASDQADPGQYSANEFKAMTYNALMSTESGGDVMSSGGVSWFDGRNEDFYGIIAANAPDIIGIQEASSPDQQDDIGARYEGSTYEYFRWDTDPNSFVVDDVPRNLSTTLRHLPS